MMGSTFFCYLLHTFSKYSTFFVTYAEFVDFQTAFERKKPRRRHTPYISPPAVIPAQAHYCPE